MRQKLPRRKPDWERRTQGSPPVPKLRVGWHIAQASFSPCQEVQNSVLGFWEPRMRGVSQISSYTTTKDPARRPKASVVLRIKT